MDANYYEFRKRIELELKKYSEEDSDFTPERIERILGGLDIMNETIGFNPDASVEQVLEKFFGVES